MSFNHYGVKRSINELNSIFSCQWSNGMLPHIRFAPLPPSERPYRPDAEDWGISPAVSGETSRPTSGITQPPVIGWCVWQVFHRIDFAARLFYHDQFCKMALALQRYHDWLFRERDPQHESLVACIHPWETGMDNSPAFAPLLERVPPVFGRRGIFIATARFPACRHHSRQCATSPDRPRLRRLPRALGFVPLSPV